MFPEIRHSAKLPHDLAVELKGTLQALAEMAGYGTNFAEVGCCSSFPVVERKSFGTSLIFG
jgi:hypothetical protein